MTGRYGQAIEGNSGRQRGCRRGTLTLRNRRYGVSWRFEEHLALVQSVGPQIHRIARMPEFGTQ
jgi:hypothetical protein